MKNIETSHDTKTNVLTVEIDLNKDFGRSASGKTIIIASSLGNQEVIEGVKLGLNVYKYPEQPKA